jgi:peptidyl-prolyl cis-trans isomerase C
LLRGLAAALLIVAMLAVGPGLAQQNGDELAAKVNGVGISQVRFDRTVDAYLRQRGLNVQAIRDPAEVSRIRTSVLDILIGQELLWQEATRKQVVVSEEQVQRELAQIRDSLQSEQAYAERIRQSGFTPEGFADDMRRRLTAREFIRTNIAPRVSVTDEDVGRYYEANRERMMAPEQVHARHILARLDMAADEQTRAAARERIDKLLAEARGEADFATLAKQHSEGPSAARGGDLGFFSREQMVKPFADSAFAMQPGQISDVVQTRFGYHIIKLEDRRAPRELALAEVSEQIRRGLTAEQVQQAVQDLVVTLRTASEVEVFATP